MGSDNSVQEFTIGKEGLSEINENDEMFAEFCDKIDLIIGGTVIRHKNMHNTTWISDCNTDNQINHITMWRRWRGHLLDVRVQSARSDQEMVLAKSKARNLKETSLDQSDRDVLSMCNRFMSVKLEVC